MSIAARPAYLNTPYTIRYTGNRPSACDSVGTFGHSMELSDHFQRELCLGLPLGHNKLSRTSNTACSVYSCSLYSTVRAKLGRCCIGKHKKCCLDRMISTVTRIVLITICGTHIPHIVMIAWYCRCCPRDHGPWLLLSIHCQFPGVCSPGWACWSPCRKLIGRIFFAG